MKIIHPSGEAYKLAPGTKLEMSRLNPFFNEFGEQSLPVTLPSDQHNRKLIRCPDDLANTSKHVERLNVMIQDGVFTVKARQAILSAKKKDGIKTSFYLNEGAFYEKLKDLQLSEIFKEKKISFSSVEEAITFVRSLMINYDERFACFPIMVDHDKKDGYAYINEISRPEKSDGYYPLYNEVTRTETIDENTLNIPAGYYISPFIRGRHLLKEIFSHIGYQLIDDSLLLTQEPFKSVVFLNNNIDTIVKKEILYSQIVPECTASDILNVYRIKYCCEFIPDETFRTIRIELFNDVVNAAPYRDLSSITCSSPDITYPSSFRQLLLSASKQNVTTERKASKNIRGIDEIRYSSENIELKTILDRYPDAEFDKITGRLFRIGFKANKKVKEFIGSIHCNYSANDNLTTVKKESPDTYIRIFASPDRITGGRHTYGGIYPYIGKSRALNSAIVYEGDTEEEISKNSEKTDKLEIMICFVCHDSTRKYDIGTVFNYDNNGKKLWDYTLAYNGPEGLFEKFWRRYDTLLRNSLLDVSYEQILSETDKLSVSSYKKVVINNQELLPNDIKYIPGRRTTTTCSYLTTRLREPISEALSEYDKLKDTLYYWESKYSLSNTSKTGFILKEPAGLIYYTPPTPSQFSLGGRYHSKTYQATLYSRMSESGPVDPVDGTVTIWLEAKMY